MLNEGKSYSTEPPTRSKKTDNPVVGRFVRGEADGESRSRRISSIVSGPLSVVSC